MSCGGLQIVGGGGKQEEKGRCSQRHDIIPGVKCLDYANLNRDIWMWYALMPCFGQFRMENMKMLLPGGYLAILCCLCHTKRSSLLPVCAETQKKREAYVWRPDFQHLSSHYRELTLASARLPILHEHATAICRVRVIPIILLLHVCWEGLDIPVRKDL